MHDQSLTPPPPRANQKELQRRKSSSKVLLAHTMRGICNVNTTSHGGLSIIIDLTISHRDELVLLSDCDVSFLARQVSHMHHLIYLSIIIAY